MECSQIYTFLGLKMIWSHQSFSGLNFLQKFGVQTLDPSKNGVKAFMIKRRVVIRTYKLRALRTYKIF